jgi:plasmid stability protein
MKRTLVQFDEDTYNTLRRRAFREERSVSSLVREMVDQGLKTATAERPSRVGQFSSVAAGRSKKTSSTPVSEAHDEAVAAAFKS